MVTKATKVATTAIRIKMCLHQKDFNLQKKATIIKFNLQTKMYYSRMSVFPNLLLLMVVAGWSKHLRRRKVTLKLVEKRVRQKGFHLLVKLISQKDLMKFVIFHQRG